MTTLRAITSKPTTKTGLKTNNWLTTLDTDLADSIVSVNTSTLPDTIPVTISGKTINAQVTPWLVAALENCYGAGARYTLEQFFNMTANGFATPLQEQTFNSTQGIIANSTLVTTKANLTAEQYKNNCIKMGLDSKNIDAVIELVDTVYSLTDKTTKADMLVLLQSFAHLFINEEQHTVYTAKAIDEEQAALKFEALSNAGLTDIRVITVGRYVANIGTESNITLGFWKQHGFALIGMTQIDDVKVQVTFKDIDVTA